jgi:sugar lactone lactonase YvrE
MKQIIVTLILTAAAIFSLVARVSAHPAWGIAVDRQGQVYFSDLKTIWKIDRQGKVSTFREGVRGRHVHNITIDAEDNIYGLDNTYNPQTEKFPRSIWKMSPKGEFSYLVPLTDNLPLGRSVWRDSDGNTYSVEPYNNEKKESKIMKRTPAGTVSLFAGGKYGYFDGQKDKAEFSVITDIAFAADKTIYLTNDAKVRKIDKFGMVTTIYGKEVSSENQKKPETFSRLFGLAVDGQNNVFAADHENRRVLKISPGGEYTAVFSAEQPWSPTGVALGGSDLYILENWYDERESFIGTQVRKLSADGKITVLATVGDKPKRAANNNPVIENTRISPQNQKNVPYILFGTGAGLVMTIPIFWYCCRKLSA